MAASHGSGVAPAVVDCSRFADPDLKYLCSRQVPKIVESLLASILASKPADLDAHVAQWAVNRLTPEARSKISTSSASVPEAPLSPTRQLTLIGDRPKPPKRILVVGGVAGGASFAARARRLNEDVEIIVFEKGEYPSFANCGLPYYVGGVIKKQDDLLVTTVATLKNNHNLTVKVKHEVTSINREKAVITVKGPDGSTTEESFADGVVVLAPGANAIRPPLPGIDLPGVYCLRDIPEANTIRTWLDEHKAKDVVVVGGGFIGLETAEALHGRGIRITIVEAAPQLFLPFDSEMVVPLMCTLRNAGVAVHLDSAVCAFEKAGERLVVKTKNDKQFECDMVLLAIGVRPNTALASACGLQLGARGGIVTNQYMQTNDPRIYAVGDAVEITDFVSGQQTLIALANPANRQGRVAADHIFGVPSTYRGSQGTSVCGLFGITVACTGSNEKTLKRLNINYQKICTHPFNHASYYPNAKRMHIKVLFAPVTGKLLGCQATGTDGVERRVDVVAALMQCGGTVLDLEQAECCYAPQYGGAKDAIQLAGMAASNCVRGMYRFATWDEYLAAPAEAKPVLLDVRTKKEFDEGHPPDAVNIPVGELRGRLAEVPKGKPLFVFCMVGQRAHLATSLLALKGFDARNVTGGYHTYCLQVENRWFPKAFCAALTAPTDHPAPAAAPAAKP